MTGKRLLFDRTLVRSPVGTIIDSWAK